MKAHFIASIAALLSIIITTAFIQWNANFATFSVDQRGGMVFGYVMLSIVYHGIAFGYNENKRGH